MSSPPPQELQIESAKVGSQRTPMISKPGRNCCPSGTALTNMLLMVMVGMNLVLVVTIIFLAASVHGANSFSILPSSFPKLLTDVFGADYGTFSRELADLGNKMDSFLKPTPSDGIEASIYQGVANEVSSINFLHAMIPPNWEAYGGVGNGGKTWGILGLIFGGSPIDWMFKQIDPGDIRTLGAACQMFATNMDRTPSEWQSLSVPTVTYEERGSNNWVQVRSSFQPFASTAAANGMHEVMQYTKNVCTILSTYQGRR